MLRFLTQYRDATILILVLLAFGFASYFLWPDISPSVCSNDGRTQLPCETTDANGNSIQLTPVLCKDKNGLVSSCRFNNAAAFFTSFGLPLGAAFSWIIYFFIGEKLRKSDFIFRNDDLSRVVPLNGRNLKKNNILMLGLGRSGKSELIKTMTYGSVDVASGVTNEWKLYSFAYESYDLSSKTATKHMMFINDYRGQKGSQVTVALPHESEKIPYSGSSVNSVIFVVDLAPWHKDGDENTTYTEASKERVNEHLSQWPVNAIDPYFGLLNKENLGKVYLFINKIDQIENGRPILDNVAKARKLYSTLEKELKLYSENNEADFQCFVGSLRTGYNVAGENGLIADLITQARKNSFK